jgi:hypothetical protein
MNNVEFTPLVVSSFKILSEKKRIAALQCIGALISFAFGGLP